MDRWSLNYKWTQEDGHELEVGIWWILTFVSIAIWLFS